MNVTPSTAAAPAYGSSGIAAVASPVGRIDRRLFALFPALVLGLFAFELWVPVQQQVVLPFTAALARLSAALIGVFDTNVVSYGKVLHSNRSGFAVSIEPGCNGVEAIIILAAAMIAQRTDWRHKLQGILIGALAVEALNLVRIITLFYLGQWNNRLFEWAHMYLWQALIMLDVLVVWLLWLRWVQQPGSEKPPALQGNPGA